MAISKIVPQSTGFGDANVGLQIPNISLENRAASAANGTIFFNTSNNAIEVYANGAWVGVGVTTPPTLSSVTNMYGFDGSGLVNTTVDLVGTNFGLEEVTVRFAGGDVIESVFKTPISETSITNVNVPSAIANQQSGNTITVTVTNSSGTSGSVTKTLIGVPTGGTITGSGGYRYHKFTTSGTLTVPSDFIALSKTAEFILVAGGGAGGTDNSGGGGAGGLVNSSVTLSSTTYSIGIGGGAPTNPALNTNSASGSNSTGFGSTAIGGGAGGTGDPAPVQVNGSPGGSGGGGASESGGGTGGSGTPGQGFAGGNGGPDGPGSGGGGGGGAGAAGQVGGSPAGRGSQLGGNGGIGKQFSDWATATSSGDSGYYAGGGSGGNENDFGSGSMASGGAGGGGDSVYGNPGSPVQNAQVNTGGGGAGGTYVSPGIIYGGSGGSGICLVRYEL